MTNFFESLRQFTASQPVALQWLAVLLAGALPFVESYYGSVIGILAGVSPLTAITAAISGNLISTIGVIYVAHVIRQRRLTRQRNSITQTQGSKRVLRNPKLRRRFEKYGVVGVSLGSQVVLPSQITAAALIGIGMPIRKVTLWQTGSSQLRV